MSSAEQDLWKKSFSSFERGITNFELIKDTTNNALLLCNMGRLMRICAQAHCSSGNDERRGEFSPEEALYYNKVRVTHIRYITYFALIVSYSLHYNPEQHSQFCLR